MSGHTISKGPNYRTWKSKLEHSDCTKNFDSRQQKRERVREQAIMFVNQHYGLEPRHARRGIALTIARRNWRSKIAKEPAQ